MNRKVLKIFSIIFIAITLMCISVISFADGVATSPLDIKPKDSISGENEIMTLGGNVMGILQTTGIVISVLILIVLGIKYMMGSAEEKAEYKKTMIPYLVGAALIFGASIISNVVFQFFTNLK